MNQSVFKVVVVLEQPLEQISDDASWDEVGGPKHKVPQEQLFVWTEFVENQKILQEADDGRFLFAAAVLGRDANAPLSPESVLVEQGGNLIDRLRRLVFQENA